MCRSDEATSTQLENWKNSDAHPPSEVTFIKKPSKGADKSSFLEDCRFCSQAHEKERSKCPAFGKNFSACQKENHFALRFMYPPHKYFVNQFDFDENGEKILSASSYEEEINAIDNPSNKIQTKSRRAIMKIGGKNVKMLIDSGAYASWNVLLIKYLPKGAVVEKSSHTLKMYSKSTMSARRWSSKNLPINSKKMKT